ncbi:MAG: hypothetical protein ACRDGG_07180 [Anaerolineae bacterium]
MIKEGKRRKIGIVAHEASDGRKQGSPFEVMLEKWRRGEEVSWGELFAAWVKTPVAPRSRETVRKVIRRVEWIP